MKASRVMTKDVTCLTPEVPLQSAWEVMQRLTVRHVPVLHEGKLVGVVSDRDLLVRAAQTSTGALSFPDVPVGRAMSAPAVTCPPSASVSRIASLMLEYHIDSVPIVHADNELVGLVTSTDLLELLMEPEQVSEVLPFSFSLRRPDEKDSA